MEDKSQAKSLLFLLTLFALSVAPAQSQPAQVGRILDAPIQTPEVTTFQLRQYLIRRVPKLPTPASAEQWAAESKRLRQHLLHDVVFHGWPREWVNAPLKCDDLGLVTSGSGYRMRKLRYEIVPGFHSTAILYEPENLAGKVGTTLRVPAVLNVNGHVGTPGKAIEYKQKRCINYAKRGMIALNLEWLGFGELTHAENSHWFGAHLDLVGANAVGLFYLAMRKGLDYLYDHPNVDRRRIAVTGLSGGGWQTIVLSSLDERVSIAIPVAGYASLTSRLERPGDIGDVEQNGTDLLDGQDYSHMTAMLAPRPALLIYNAEDDCCFRAPLVKPYIFDAIKPFFRLFGKENVFAWHENVDPGDHNYQLDNRIQSYRFFGKHFNLPTAEDEIPVDVDIKSYDELVVGLPKDNLTILGLARKLAAEIHHPPIPSNGAARTRWATAERAKLKRLVRYRPLTVHYPWAVTNTKKENAETRSYRFEFSNGPDTSGPLTYRHVPIYRDGLSATGVWLKAITTPDNSPITIVLHDQGKKASRVEVTDAINRGEQVLALDLVFTGDASPGRPHQYTQMLASIGDRPLGIEAAQLIGVTNWMRKMSERGSAGSDAQRIHLVSTGIRSQVTALIACALEPNLFSEVWIREGMPSLRHLLDAPVRYETAPDLFCLDLYKQFDLDRLTALAEPTRVRH